MQIKLKWHMRNNELCCGIWTISFVFPYYYIRQQGKMIDACLDMPEAVHRVRQHAKLALWNAGFAFNASDEQAE